MAKLKILQEDQSYTFRSYFEMTFPVDQILAELGYQFKSDSLILPKSDRSLSALNSLKQEIQTSLTLTLLSSESARREIIIAPILLAVSRFCNCPLRIEQPLQLSQWLKGNLDYLLWLKQSFLVVEAKHEDLSRGFTQLAAEMIALTQAEDLEILYGAVTIGDAWRFGKLDQLSKTITQDILLYTVPGQLEQLLQILVGILQGDSPND